MHEEDLNAVMAGWYNNPAWSAHTGWSVDDIVRFESHAFALQNAIDAMLVMVCSQPPSVAITALLRLLMVPQPEHCVVVPHKDRLAHNIHSA